MKLVIEIEDVMYALVMSQEPKEKEYWLYHVKHGKPLDNVLDKIRAEIPKLTCGDNEYRQALVKVADVIKCIDKHRAESEDKG